MKIVAITNSRIPSLTANSIQAMKVCDALGQLGHTVQLVAPAETPPMNWADLSKHYGLRHPFSVVWYASIRALRRLDFVWLAQRAAERARPDLIYTWLPQSAAFARARGYPTLLEMHADVAGRFGAWWLRRFWLTAGRKRLLVTTRALQAALERSTGLRFGQEDVRVAPNGVDLERYAGLPDAAQARQDLNLPAQPTVGFTGHFYRGRGMELLQGLAAALPQVTFLWVGGTADAVDEWRRKLAATGITNVVMPGFVANDRLPLFQAAADVLLMPYGASISSSSGQDIAEVINPMKMFEYMAAERPIVTADISSIREVLDDECAVFCQPGDAEEWRAAVQRLLSDSQLRMKFARKARQRVDGFTWHARAELALAGLPG
jgi:glycosyltransferase involved in cell wall biosynthesis